MFYRFLFFVLMYHLIIQQIMQTKTSVSIGSFKLKFCFDPSRLCNTIHAACAWKSQMSRYCLWSSVVIVLNVSCVCLKLKRTRVRRHNKQQPAMKRGGRRTRYLLPVRADETSVGLLVSSWAISISYS